MSGMSPIQFGGLASGMDTNAIIEGLVSIEKMRLNPIIQRQASINNEISAIGTLKNKISTLSTLAGKFKSSSSFNVFNTSSSDEKSVKVRAVGNRDIGQGTASIEVKELAEMEKIRSDAFASPIDSLGMSGKISINSVEIDILESDSLRDIRDRINATADTDITATILQISDNDHRLILTSKDGGEQGAIYEDVESDIFQQLGILSDATTKNADNILQEGRNSVVVIDNMEIVRSSNVIDDVIDGLEISLLQAEIGKNITIDFSRDTGGIVEIVEEFVNGINDVIKHISDNSKFDEESDTRGDLFNSTTARRVMNDLRSIINTDLSQFLPSGFGSLSEIGITSNRETGLLQINDDKLQDRINQDFSSVVKLFAVSGSSDTTGLTYGRSTKDTKSGVYAIDAVSVPPTIGGDEAIFNGTILTSIEGNSKGLSVTVEPGVESGNITFTKGISALLEDITKNNMLDVSDGYLNSSQKYLNNLSREQDKRMDVMEGRIETYRLRLVNQFSQTEMLISRLGSQSQSLMALNNMFQQR